MNSVGLQVATVANSRMIIVAVQIIYVLTNPFRECHGSYADQTHIDGEKPENEGDFYGIGYATTSQCRINFDCED